MNGDDEQQVSKSVQPMYEYAATDEISLIELINVVLKNRRLVVVVPAIVFILVVGYTFLQPRTYSASASFTPQTSSGQRSLSSSLAAQFGFAIPGSEASQSPQFYADLLKSREILRPLLDPVYIFESGGIQIQGTLPELLEIENDDLGLVREVTLRTLGELVSVSTDRETGLVSFSVKTWWPELSSRICKDLLDQLNRFNVETRQSQATAQRRFVEARLDVVRDSLRTAEDALQEFLQKNRQWQGAPELEFIHDRLQREVTMRQQIFTSLNQAYEQARIDEVRDTPVLTVVERPEAPVLPDRRRLLLKGILALMVGAMLGVFGAFGREFMQRGRQQESDEFAEYERLKKETLRDLRRPWRLLKG
ncbi:Wzz/FepE/Etk N-terminal domain-containing protein [Gemmatimonadota bacterium]